MRKMSRRGQRRRLPRLGLTLRSALTLGLSLVWLLMLMSSIVSWRVKTAEGQSIGRISDGAPEAIVVVTRDGTLSSWRSSGSSGAQWRCGYYAIVAPQVSVLDPSPVVDWASGPVTPLRGEYYMLGCNDTAGVRVHTRYVAFDPRDPFGGAGATERAVDEARRRLELPDPSPRVNPPDAQLVGLPMWMWLNETWERRSTVASIGDVWASVEAWPEAAHWEFEDGTSVWCDQGRVYDIWRHPREQSSDCTHTFTHSSLWSTGGVEWVRVTVHWGIEWQASDGRSESLGTLSRTAEFPVRVVEAQALVR